VVYRKLFNASLVTREIQELFWDPFLGATHYRREAAFMWRPLAVLHTAQMMGCAGW
jgi:hypothetical protein